MLKNPSKEQSLAALRDWSNIGLALHIAAEATIKMFHPETIRPEARAILGENG